MDKTYQPNLIEEKISRYWERANCFTAKIDPKKKPYTILLPPPNANDPLHIGHALYVVEDILCRYHRMKGDPTLFLPGTDHAGIETQFVFEKKLAKEGKSRFNFDRETLYKMINDFVEENRGIAKTQLKRLGFSLDWSRERYTLDPKILEIVFSTFKKLYQDGLIYRGEKIINYCTSCGTAFSDLEINHREQEDLLYYLDYGPIKIATTRPETIFADVAVAVNPADKRYKKLLGQTATIPLLGSIIPIIASDLVDINFGTGALKITPGHDPTDFEIGRQNNLQIKTVVDQMGRLINVPEKYAGQNVKTGRQMVVDDLRSSGKLLKTEPLTHMVNVCYRCKNILEPTIAPQWFVKMAPLAQSAIKAVKTGKLKIIPKRFSKLYLQWLGGIRDWNISRQIVWGPRIPIWYCLDCNPEINLTFLDSTGRKINGAYKQIKEHYSFEEIEKGLQTLRAPKEATFSIENSPCSKCRGKNLLQETDTFDTWFSSGQWPLTTLGYPDSPDFKYFYPTSVLDTMWDILFFWVARMVMFGHYLTGKSPFEIAHMHCRAVDAKGQKISKSKGNVVNPMVLAEKYGADALRMALVFGAAPGSDICLSEDKVRAMRNFTNKIWNIGRFISLKTENLKENPLPKMSKKTINKEDERILEETNVLIKSVTAHLENYRFDLAAEEIYQFLWHRLADQYLESIKSRTPENQVEAIRVAKQVYLTTVTLLHPFMPFVTEEIWRKFLPDSQPLAVSSWPNA